MMVNFKFDQVPNIQCKCHGNTCTLDIYAKSNNTNNISLHFVPIIKLSVGESPDL